MPQPTEDAPHCPALLDGAALPQTPEPAHRAPGFPACCPCICRGGPGRRGAPVEEAGGVSIAVVDRVWAKAPTAGNERLALLAPADACSPDEAPGCRCSLVTDCSLRCQPVDVR